MTEAIRQLDVGKIKLQWRGTYAGGTTYEIDDVVMYDDTITTSAYVCVANSTGNVPSSLGTVDTTYWNLMAQGAQAVAAGTGDGQIQYKNTTGFAATSLLFYDTTNNYLGISSTIPTNEIDVLGDTSVTSFTNITGIGTIKDLVVDNVFDVKSIRNDVNVIAGGAESTSHIDVLTSSSVLFTANSGGTWTHNIRGDASTLLDSIMSTGQTLTVTVISSQNNASYYSSQITIDGSAVTEYWINNTTPSSGSASGYDVYRWVITKTGASTFLVFASQNQ